MIGFTLFARPHGYVAGHALLLTVAVGMAAPHPARADVLAVYSFEANSAASSDAQPDTGADDLAFGPFTGGTFEAGTAIASNALRLGTNTTGTSAGDSDTLAESLSLGNYVSVTLKPNANSVSLSSLTFDHAFVNGAGTTSNVSVFTNLMGFAEGDVLDTFTFTTVTGDTAVTERTVDLATGLPELQGVTTDIELRLYFWDNSDTGSRLTVIDDLQLNGTVVPEPGSVSLLLVAAGLILSRRSS